MNLVSEVYKDSDSLILLNKPSHFKKSQYVLKSILKKIFSKEECILKFTCYFNI